MMGNSNISSRVGTVW